MLPSGAVPVTIPLKLSETKSSFAFAKAPAGKTKSEARREITKRKLIDFLIFLHLFLSFLSGHYPSDKSDG